MLEKEMLQTQQFSAFSLLPKGASCVEHMHSKGPFTQVLFVAATRYNFFVTLKLQQVSNMSETPVRSRQQITLKNRSWFTRAILKLQLWCDENCIKLPRQKSLVKTDLK